MKSFNLLNRIIYNTLKLDYCLTKRRLFMVSKWYLLRLGRYRSDEKSLNLFGGLSDQEEKPFSHIQKEIQKALDYGYQKICLPWNFIYHSRKDLLFSLILENPQLFVLSVHKKSFRDFITILQQAIESKKHQLFKQSQFFKVLFLKRRIKKQLCLNYLIDKDPFFFKEYEKNTPLFCFNFVRL